MCYYDSISKGYDELHGEEQKRKLKIIRTLINPKPDETLLDVGCGTGISTDFDCICAGIDPSEELVKVAKDKYPKKKFLVASAECIPFRDSSFDYVISVSAVHNFSDIGRGLDEIKRVGKDNFVFTVLRRSPRCDEIIKKIKSVFSMKKIIEEDKDIILST